MFTLGRIKPLAIAGLLAVAAASCGNGNGSGNSQATRPSGVRSIPTGADHECVVPGGSSPVLDWNELRNPILSSASAGEKDEATVWFAGKWHMLFSYVRNNKASPDGVAWDIATSTSSDFVHWSAPIAWPAQPGTLGVASPEIARAPDGLFVVTYQSDPGQVDGAQDRLYYRTSANLATWSAPHPLAPNLAPDSDDRMIDGSLAWTGKGLILGYKAGVSGDEQAFENCVVTRRFARRPLEIRRKDRHSRIWGDRGARRVRCRPRSVASACDLQHLGSTLDIPARRQP